jgi:putative glycosyltransferase
MKLSIVTTLYQSAPYIAEFYQRTSAIAKQFAGEDYEIVMVNDGSPDNSLDLAVHLTESDSHVVVIDLSRNFGHHKAMMTGLNHTKGRFVFLIDSDLEEEPEWLISFAEHMNREKCDVVYGVQEKRKGEIFEQWSGKLFYRLFRMLTGLNLPDNIVVARLMTRRYVDALIQHCESEIFIAGLWLITGFEQQPQKIRKHSTSLTTYTLRKKISQFIDSITSFSSAPLAGIFFVGSIIFFISCLYSVYLIANWFILAQPPSGYTSLMVSIWLLGGMIIAFVGVIGIYLSKVYSETKQRPYTIVRSVFRNDFDGGES